MVQTVMDLLGLMVSGKPPNMGNNATPFMKKILGRCQFFVRFTSLYGELTGVKAVEAHMSKLNDKGSHACSISDIEPIVVYKWLLPVDD